MQGTTTHPAMNIPNARSSALPKMSWRAAITSWALQVLSAAILGQTLFFKFTAAPESVYIFTTLGVEPWGRIAAAVSELVAVVLLLVPRTTVIGAAMSIGIMLGAIGAHFGPLGIVVKDDDGLLFALAVTVFVSSVIILLLRRAQAVSLLRTGLGKIGIRPRGIGSGGHG